MAQISGTGEHSMYEQKEVSYFMNLASELIMKKKGDLYCLFIPELSIFVTDENLEAAHQKLLQEKEAFFSRVIELDASDRIAKPRGEKKEQRLIPALNELVPLFIKTLVVAVVFMILLSVVLLFLKPIGNSIGTTLSTTVQRSLSSLTNLPAEAVGSSIEVLRNKVGSLYQNEIYRIRILGLITYNPAVHYRASLLKEKSGDIRGAVEEMELALGLLSRDSADTEVKQSYKNRLAALKKALNPAGETTEGAK